jgi:uncharacterized protein (DUF2267 family)
MPVPAEYQRARNDFYAFLIELRNASDLWSTHVTYTMAQGVLQVFRRRISTIRDAITFANVLPVCLRALFVADWDTEEPRKNFGSFEEMNAEVKTLRPNHNFSVENAIQVMAQTLRGHVEVSARIDEWISHRLEDWLGLTINREKTSVVRLKQGESLDFLGFTFRYDRDLYGGAHTYLNVIPSKTSLKKARETIREKAGPKMCYKPTPAVVQDLNTYLKGWCGYFKYGYPRKGFRDIGHYCRVRMTTHLNRRSQRKYDRPKGLSNYEYLQKLGLLRL